MDDRFVFEEGVLQIDDLVFRLGFDWAYDVWRTDPDENNFLLYKSRRLIEEFDTFFSSWSDVQPRSVFEIGIWEGGSPAFWFEYFRPKMHVAVDKIDREDSAHFRRYVESRGIGERLKTYWNVDQADEGRLREIVQTEFSMPLDLVIDDGSHLLDPTRSSFEALFPFLRCGGLYVIEDWNWELMSSFRKPGHPFASKPGLVGLVEDLARVTGSSDVIHSLTIRRNFVAAEKGTSPLEDDRFDLGGYVAALPAGPLDV